MLSTDNSKFQLRRLRAHLHFAYRLLTNNTPSGSVEWGFHYLLTTFNILYMIFIILETADGPNKYEHRENLGLYPQLLSQKQYRIVKMILSAPLIVRCISRLFVSVFLEASSLMQAKAASRTKFFKQVPNYFLSIWYIPLVIEICRPGLWPRKYMGLYHLIDFMRHMQIIESFKLVPSLAVVRETFRRVVRLLPIPVFLFVCFNIFFGLLIFIVDPCYDETSCPFRNLSDAVFYSVVTMTTSKWEVGWGWQAVSIYLALSA